MIVWVLYDIENDKARTRVAKACQRAGLYRVQYSCFLGEIEVSEKDTLELQIEDWIDVKKDKVYIFPMNRGELADTVCLGQALDKKLITNDVQVLFF